MHGHWLSKVVFGVACFVGLMAMCRARSCWQHRPLPQVRASTLAGYFRGITYHGDDDLHFSSYGSDQIRIEHLGQNREVWIGPLRMVGGDDFQFTGRCYGPTCASETACKSGLWGIVGRRKACRMLVTTVTCNGEKRAPNSEQRDGALTYYMRCNSEISANGSCDCEASTFVIYRNAKPVGWERQWVYTLIKR